MGDNFKTLGRQKGRGRYRRKGRAIKDMVKERRERGIGEMKGRLGVVRRKRSGGCSPSRLEIIGRIA